MLSYTRELTLNPAFVSDKDVDALRVAGFSDRAILEINLAASYMNFVNRVAQGLGVEIEPSLAVFRR